MLTFRDTCIVTVSRFLPNIMIIGWIFLTWDQFSLSYAILPWLPLISKSALLARCEGNSPVTRKYFHLMTSSWSYLYGVLTLLWSIYYHYNFYLLNLTNWYEICLFLNKKTLMHVTIRIGVLCVILGTYNKKVCQWVYNFHCHQYAISVRKVILEKYCTLTLNPEIPPNALYLHYSYETKRCWIPLWWQIHDGISWNLKLSDWIPQKNC